MEQITKTPCWVRGGKIEEIVWIGKEVLAWCIGLYIVFFHVAKKRQTIRWCWNNVTGDGARCMSGHVSSPVFAFSERSLCPRIFVHAYPSMTKICECAQGCSSGYLALAFTPQDHLVSLGSYPNFPMIVWCWRTGEKIAVVDTPIRDEVGQTIKITPMGRTVIGQVGKTCGRLLIWELDVVDRVVILKGMDDATIHEISWCPTLGDPVLVITDLHGHVYLSNHDGTDVQRIIFSQRCWVCAHVELPAVCWFHEGIILRTTFCQIRYFKRDSRTNAWRKQWYVKATYEPYILIVHPLRNDRLFYYTYEGYLMQMTFPVTDGAPTIHSHFRYGGRYRFVDFLYPWCHHLAVTDNPREVTILVSHTGAEVSRMELDMEGAISAQISHPDEPSIVVVSDQGEMMILGVIDPEQPTILAYLRLQRKPLDLVKFSPSGKFLIAAQRETGKCYFVRLERDQPYGVIAQLRVKPFVDVVVQEETRECLKVLVLLVECKQFNVAAGQQFLAYDIPLDLSVEPKVTGVVTLPGLFYDLCRAPGDNPDLLIASSYLKRQLHVLRLRRDEAILTEVAFTGHHVRLFRAFTDRRWIATCAYDGLVVVHDETVRRVVAVVPAHHRLDSGTRKAIVNSEGDIVVALGHDGSLVAICVSYAGKTDFRSLVQDSAMSVASIGVDDVYRLDDTWYERQRETILADYVSLDPAIRALLTRARQECPASDETRTWEEWREDTRRQEERELCAAEKAAIGRDLADLTITLRQLVDANETCPEVERLPMSAFDLDEIGRARRLKAAASEREDFRAELERLCASMDRAAGWIRATLWDPQVVLGRSIFSFRSDTEVTNYPMIAGDPHFEDHLRWARFARDTESRVVDVAFQPWRRYTNGQLRAILSAPVRVRHDDVYEKERMRAFLEEEDQEPSSEGTAETRELDGMTTHRFVERSPYYYSQTETYGFAHATLEDRFLMHDCNRLREYFNKLFDDVRAAKKREMSAIREKNEKIRHVDAELRVMFGRTVPRVPSDPRFHFKEEVECVIEVLDHEVKTRPYVSLSQQEVLDRRAAERERIERLSLADDFRERALMKMMHGVLEVRWEDTIKMDVRRPACMMEKQPEQYTHEDVAAVRKYEADVEVLRQERERYRRMLEADYAKISGLLQDGIEKFDAKLNEFFQLKLTVDAAINQLKLRHYRGRLRNLAKVEAVREDDELIRKMAEKRHYKTVLEEHTRNLRSVHQDMLAQHDALSAREKATMKRHQQEFSGLSKTAIEHLERQYKRRPRLPLRSVTASDLVDLAKLVADQIKPAYLLAECAEYARILESVDARPDDLPQSINANQWDHFVRARRQKIEIELRIRARQLEIAAAERTITVFEGKIDACKSRADLLRSQLKRTRDERVTREQDAEIQLVLKMGQVEMKLRGDQRDVAGGILVPRREIERVNEHIAAAGARKLDSLKRAIDFRHGTLMLEWEHRCLKTRFEELQEDLQLLQDLAITWDMRVYLKRKAKGLRDDKTASQLERRIEATQSTLEKTLSRQTDKLREIREKIGRVRKENAALDRAVTKMNVTRWELEHRRDVAQETREREHMDRKMRLLRKRSDLVKQLQDGYVELLALQTENELLKLRTYPTLEYAEADKLCY